MKPSSRVSPRPSTPLPASIARVNSRTVPGTSRPTTARHSTQAATSRIRPSHWGCWVSQSIRNWYHWPMPRSLVDCRFDIMSVRRFPVQVKGRQKRWRLEGWTKKLGCGLALARTLSSLQPPASSLQPPASSLQPPASSLQPLTIRPGPLCVKGQAGYNLSLSLPSGQKTMTESVHDYMTRLGRAAREASRVLARASTAQKNRALQAAASALDAARAELSAANEQDLASGRSNGLDEAMLDRLALTPARIDDMIEGLRQVAA